MKALLLVAAIATAYVPLSMTAQIDRVTGRAFATRSEVIAQHGMVCTSQPLATQVGLDVRDDGNRGREVDVSRRHDPERDGTVEP